MNILLSVIVSKLTSSSHQIVTISHQNIAGKVVAFEAKKKEAPTCSLSNVVKKDIYILIHIIYAYIYTLYRNVIDTLYTKKMTFIFVYLIYLYYKQTQLYIIIIYSIINVDIQV